MDWSTAQQWLNLLGVVVATFIAIFLVCALIAFTITGIQYLFSRGHHKDFDYPQHEPLPPTSREPPPPQRYR